MGRKTYDAEDVILYVLVTTNPQHPAYNVVEANLHIVLQKELNLKDVLICLKKDYGCNQITIQTGGTLNECFLRDKLFDYIDIIVAPVLIGEKNTATLIDGNSLTSTNELDKLGILHLESCHVLKNSYIRLSYRVIA